MATNTICFSVGTSTSDFNSGGTITISSGVATFNTAQTSTSIGRGDKVRFSTTSYVYLWTKNSSTEWQVRTANGQSPANQSEVTIDDIKRSFNGIDLAIQSTSNADVSSSGAYVLINESSADLTTGDLDADLKICCYKDGVDTITSKMSIYGWTTDATHSVLVYVPTGTDEDGATDCNVSQYHAGVVNGGYRLACDTSSSNFDLWGGASATSKRTYNVTVRGLQLEFSSGNWKYCDLVVDTGTHLYSQADSYAVWENCIFYTGDFDQAKANQFTAGGGNNSGGVTIRNCMFVSDPKTSSAHDPYSGIDYDSNYVDSAKERCFFYNNTIVGEYAVACFVKDESSGSSGAPHATHYSHIFNNCCMAVGGAGLAFDFVTGVSQANDDPGFENNAGSDTSGGTSNGNVQSVVLATCNFVSTSAGSQNFHITTGSTLEDEGLGTSDTLADGTATTLIDYDITDDLASGSRPSTAADIGVDEITAAAAGIPSGTHSLLGVGK